MHFRVHKSCVCGCARRPVLTSLQADNSEKNQGLWVEFTSCFHYTLIPKLRFLAPLCRRSLPPTPRLTTQPLECVIIIKTTRTWTRTYGGMHIVGTIARARARIFFVSVFCIVISSIYARLISRQGMLLPGTDWWKPDPDIKRQDMYEVRLVVAKSPMCDIRSSLNMLHISWPHCQSVPKSLGVNTGTGHSSDDQAVIFLGPVRLQAVSIILKPNRRRPSF